MTTNIAMIGTACGNRSAKAGTSQPPLAGITGFPFINRAYDGSIVVNASS
jgi:hypothetical protein